MLCFNCKQEISDTYVKCPHCGADLDDKVRVMSPSEQLHYDGITIDENENGQTDYNAQSGSRGGFDSGGNVRIKQIKLQPLGSGWMTKIAIAVILAAIAGFLLFVFLPVALLAVAVGIVIWFILSFFRQ